MSKVLKIVAKASKGKATPAKWSKRPQKQKPSANAAFIGPLPKKVQRWTGEVVPNARPMTGAPAAVSSKLPRIGMSDLKNHVISWITGYVYVGNGTLGQTDQIYFRPALQQSNIFIGNIPILAADLTLGAGYVRDIEKHYSSKVVHGCRLRLHALQPSTSNSMEVIVAPVRGAMNTDDCVSVNNASAAGLLYSLVGGMNKVMQAASWEEGLLGLTEFVAGGSGALQNEFPMDAEGSGGFISADNRGLIPCAFAVSGVNSTTALRGTNTHAIVVEQQVSYMDFVGDNIAGEVPASDWMKNLEERRRLSTALKVWASGNCSDRKDQKSDLTRPPATATGSLERPPLKRSLSGESLIDVKNDGHFGLSSRKEGSNRARST